MTLDHDGRVKLSLGAVNMRDAGVYKCVATNEVGRVEATVHLAVEPKCAGSYEAPLDESFAEPSLSAAVNSQIPYVQFFAGGILIEHTLVTDVD